MTVSKEIPGSTNSASSALNKALEDNIKNLNEAAIKQAKMSTCDSIASLKVEADPKLSELPSETKTEFRNFFAQQCAEKTATPNKLSVADQLKTLDQLTQNNLQISIQSAFESIDQSRSISLDNTLEKAIKMPKLR